MKEEFLKRFRPTISAIASLAIAWNIIKTFFDNMDTTAMLIAIGITALAVLLLPDIVKKIWPFYAIVSTGIAIIAVNLIGYNPIPLIIVISLITIITDSLVINLLDLSTIIFDTMLSFLASITICFFSTDIFSILCLLPMYVVIFIVKAKFGLKRPYEKADEKESNKSENETSQDAENQIETACDNNEDIVYVDDIEE